MNTYCPLINENCKDNECVMWKGENCLIVTFLGIIENAAQQSEKEFEETKEEIEEETFNEIKSSTAEELAGELVSFAKKEFPDQAERWIHTVTELFWKSKNIGKWNECKLTADIELKIKKAEILAQEQLISEKEVREKVTGNEQLSEKEVKEKEQLVSLVDPCVDWAKKHGLKKVAEAYIDAFLLEKNIDVSPRTKKRQVYAMVNSKLEKEKMELSSLVKPYVDWAKEHGLKKATEADVDAFLLEKNIDVSPRTKKRELYAMVKKATACE